MRYSSLTCRTQRRGKPFLRYILKRGGRTPVQFDLSLLEEETDGFSGSEIEQVIISGLYTSFSLKKELSTEVLLKEISLTVPISVTMADKKAKISF